MEDPSGLDDLVRLLSGMDRMVLESVRSLEIEILNTEMTGPKNKLLRKLQSLQSDASAARRRLSKVFLDTDDGRSFVSIYKSMKMWPWICREVGTSSEGKSYIMRKADPPDGYEDPCMRWRVASSKIPGFVLCDLPSNIDETILVLDFGQEYPDLSSWIHLLVKKHDRG